jgi:hypothetical protein
VVDELHAGDRAQLVVIAYDTAWSRPAAELQQLR